MEEEYAQPSGLPGRSVISHQNSLVCGGALTFQSLERRSCLTLLVTLGRAEELPQSEVCEGECDDDVRDGVWDAADDEAGEAL